MIFKKLYFEASLLSSLNSKKTPIYCRSLQNWLAYIELLEIFCNFFWQRLLFFWQRLLFFTKTVVFLTKTVVFLTKTVFYKDCCYFWQRLLFFDKDCCFLWRSIAAQVLKKNLLECKQIEIKNGFNKKSFVKIFFMCFLNKYCFLCNNTVSKNELGLVRIFMMESQRWTFFPVQG